MFIKNNQLKRFAWSLLAIGLLCVPDSLSAKKGPEAEGRPATNPDRIEFRAACDNAVKQTDMEINNVRARLTTGGDVWWDGDNGRYIVPKTPPGVPEVSSIFAGAVWLGGQDPGGGLKVSAQQYGRSAAGGAQFDYYPGPLTAEGTTSRDTCKVWDRFFRVTGASIREVRQAYEEAIESGNARLDVEQIPEDVLGWPGTANPYFFETNGFGLPDISQGDLAGFHDENNDGIYDPTDGDYPKIEIRGCNTTPQFPEEMIFWIYNDAGNTHRQSNTTNQIRMEVQVQAFAYNSADDINNMTFQRYKLINRAPEDIIDTYFAMWVDPDLGCFEDDYVGCDTVRSLAYVYNEDARDGVGTSCECSGVETYCDDIPILGVDYFRGPRAPIYDNDTLVGEIELGMSSFIYMNNRGVGDPPDGTTDPETAPEYYNYLQGRWRDGSTLCNNGSGYQANPCPPTRYIFPDAPDDASGQSMVTANLPMGDRRTLQASGPFTLQPGAVNELIIGVVWVGSQSYPNPSIRRLQQADDLAQSLFDNCFDLCDGPDAPNVDILELDKEIVLLLSNDRFSNNYNENYTEPGLGIPDSVTIDGETVQADSLYRFEGYRVFQFAGPSVTLGDLDNPDVSREIARFDLDNGITDVFNWEPVEDDDNPLPGTFLAPELKVAGGDNGISHSLSIKSDAFAAGGETQLVNHRRYYFTVIAYGYNNYKEYDPYDFDESGQAQQYKASSLNIGDRLVGTDYYTVIPRPILYEDLMADYGTGIPITRLAGEGNSGNFLDMDSTTRAATEEVFRNEEAFADEELNYNGELSYVRGAGPFDLFISNPFNVRDGRYEIKLFEDDPDGRDLDEGALWMLRCLDGCTEEPILSERPINEVNEQLIAEYGFSVAIRHVPEPGEEVLNGNGVIGGALEYDDPDGDRWLTFINDEFNVGVGGSAFNSRLYNYVNTGETEAFEDIDPKRDFDNLFPGVYPFKLMDWNAQPGNQFFFSPIWLTRGNSMASVASELELNQLNNVDIIFTSDKSLWSRCPIIETASFYYDNVEIDGEPITEGIPNMFDTRNASSVSKEAGPDGLPQVDANIGMDLETGMGWFPGYAVDVETGKRLEIFFGENSLYDGRILDADNDVRAPDNGADMMFNPSSDLFFNVPNSPFPNPYFFPGGGQHYFYVTSEPYDRGEDLENRLAPRRNNPGRKNRALENVTWAGFPLLAPGSELLSYADGLIPNDATLKLRVNNPFDYAEGVPEVIDNAPTYQFTIESKSSQELTTEGVDNALDRINVVPNPYYAYSQYETSALDGRIKITNLPDQATVTIYDLSGKFIREYKRDESPTELRGGNRPFGKRQTTPALVWDLRNFRGIPVASGVYLIHVAAPGLGERTLKFFGVQREFDPSGL